MPHSVLAKSAELAWAILESYDIDPIPLFQQAHIDPRLMRDMSARISQTAMTKLWVSVADKVDDPCFGLRSGKLWHPSYMHALGYAWMTSSTLRTALERLARYANVVNQSLEILLSEKDKQLTVIPVNTFTARDDPWDEDGAISIITTMCRTNFGDSLDPIAVTFKHDEPGCAADFYEFFRCPVEFGNKNTSLVLASEDVDKRLPSSNPLLSQINDQEMIKYLANLDKNDIVQGVKATIIKLLPDGKISDVKVADALFMSNRKLQRKLQAKGTTFKTILTDVRVELVMKYIQDRQLTLTEISFQLGFSEMSAFSRAFKTWTGKSPREYRQTA